MILAVDVYYFDYDKAKAVGVVYKNWNDIQINELHSLIIDNVSGYQSGEFYRRELPCIVALLNILDITKFEIIVIDGYVYLDNDKKAGLGTYLYNHLDKGISIIGVAKTSFHNNENHTVKVLRGSSKKPLYVTAVGINLNQAANYIASMAGEYRIPTLLKLLDNETKSISNSVI